MGKVGENQLCTKSWVLSRVRCGGAVVGAAATLLLTPASGDELRNRAVNHWENTLSEARQAQAESRRTLENRFETMRYGATKLRRLIAVRNA